MNILFTGANGFLGSNVIPLLVKNEHSVITLSRNNADIKCDIASEIPILPENKIDLVFHAAGKAHSVPKNSIEENDFYNVNAIGTENLCKGLERNPPAIFVFVSTVAVYGRDSGEKIDESAELCGMTPYAKSKLMAEEFLQTWCEKYNVKLFIFRPSLIAGPNPPGNLGDMISAIKKGKYANIAGGKAKKSIMWVEDFAQLIEKTVSSPGGIYNICDNYEPDFYEISKTIASHLKKPAPKNIPYFVAKSLAFLGDFIGEKAPINSLRLKKLMSPLTFSNQKVCNEMEYKPSPVMEKFMK